MWHRDNEKRISALTPRLSVLFAMTRCQKSHEAGAIPIHAEHFPGRKPGARYDHRNAHRSPRIGITWGVRREMPSLLAAGHIVPTPC